jgi:hypothetical protein
VELLNLDSGVKSMESKEITGLQREFLKLKKKASKASIKKREVKVSIN